MNNVSQRGPPAIVTLSKEEYYRRKRIPMLETLAPLRLTQQLELYRSPALKGNLGESGSLNNQSSSTRVK